MPPNKSIVILMADDDADDRLLARDALGDDDPDGAAVVEEGPLKPNPVTQDEMDAGSVELF